MNQELTGNVLVAQSGGPTSVINASLVGVIKEALNHECIGEIYGGMNGIKGILNEELVDLAAQSQQTIRALRYTPGAALGTCRYKLNAEQDLESLLKIFEAHSIRYFFYIGGNDSQDTTAKIAQYAQSIGYDLRAIGIPKTIDNDLPITDHCPGYGSVIKYIATTVREMALDNAAMSQGDLVSILEVMGRNSGWIASGAMLAKRRHHPEDAPHLIYLPEVAFSSDKFLKDVQAVLAHNKYCFVVVSEGIKDADGNHVAEQAVSKDAFGHAQLGGAGEYLRLLIDQNLPGIKARSAKLGINQRAAATCASLADNNEAYLCGEVAVKAAIKGETGKMVTLVRGDQESYTCETSLTALSDVANHSKHIPSHWIAEDGVSLTSHFLRYATPLIQGEVKVEFEHGLPRFGQLENLWVTKKLSPLCRL